MNFYRILISMTCFFILTACASPGGSDSQNTEYPAPEIVPTNTVVQNREIAYPALNDNDAVMWIQAKTMILNGEVEKISQSASLAVTIYLKDGRSFNTFQPSENEVETLIKECGDKCKDIQVISE